MECKEVKIGQYTVRSYAYFTTIFCGRSCRKEEVKEQLLVAHLHETVETLNTFLQTQCTVFLQRGRNIAVYPAVSVEM